MGRRTNPRLAQSKPPPGKGFRGVDRERQSVGLHCLGAAAHQEISLTLTQCFFDTIQLFRFRFRHLAPWGSEFTKLKNKHQYYQVFMSCEADMQGSSVSPAPAQAPTSPSPWSIPAAASDPLDYCVDAWQRMILLWDVLRQRGNNYVEHNARKAPHVLSFAAQLVLDGR